MHRLDVETTGETVDAQPLDGNSGRRGDRAMGRNADAGTRGWGETGKRRRGDTAKGRCGERAKRRWGDGAKPRHEDTGALIAASPFLRVSQSLSPSPNLPFSPSPLLRVSASPLLPVSPSSNCVRTHAPWTCSSAPSFIPGHRTDRRVFRRWRAVAYGCSLLPICMAPA